MLFLIYTTAKAKMVYFSTNRPYAQNLDVVYPIFFLDKEIGFITHNNIYTHLCMGHWYS